MLVWATLAGLRGLAPALALSLPAQDLLEQTQTSGMVHKQALRWCDPTCIQIDSIGRNVLQ
jgi:hypothetical protein